MSARQHSSSSSHDSGSVRQSQSQALPPIPTITRNSTTSRENRGRARRSAVRLTSASPSLSEIHVAGASVDPSVPALRWVLEPVTSSAARVNELIGNLIDSSPDSAVLHQQHVDTERILDARLTLMEQQANRIERNLNYLVRHLKNWVRHEAEETPEGEFLCLRVAVLRIATRIGDIDPLIFGRDDSDSDRSV